MQEVFYGTSHPSYGDLVLKHQADIKLTVAGLTMDDVISGWSVRGRSITIKLGGAELAYADYYTVFTGRMGMPEWDDTEVSIPVYDLYDVLSKAQVTQNTFASGGSMPADTVGQWIPVCVGYCRQVPAVLVNTSGLEYQVHDPTVGGAIQAVSAAYVDGAAVSIASTDLSGGRFTLSTAPTGGKVTADVAGAKFGGTFYPDLGSIVENLILDLTTLTASNIDATLMTAFKSAFAYNVGMYVDGEAKLSAVIDEMVSGLPVYYGFTREGKFGMSEFTAPSGSATLDMTRLERLSGSLEGSVEERIHRQVSVGYAYKFGGDGQRYQFSTTTDDTALAALCPDADKGSYMTRLYDVTGGAAVAVKWDALLGAPRKRYKGSAKGLFVQADLGSVMSYTSTRFGLDAGALLRVVAIEEDYSDNVVIIEGWG